MRNRFDARALGTQFAFLSGLNSELSKFVFASSFGSLEERVEGVRAWRDAFQSGALPPHGTWPSDAISASARKAISELGILRFAAQDRSLADELLRDTLQSFVENGELISRELEARIQELESLERKRLAKASVSELDAEAIESLRRMAENEMGNRIPTADEALLAGWTERVRLWNELSKVFDDLSPFFGRGLDLGRSVLKHIGWSNLLALRRLLATLPKLREVIAALGRFVSVDEGEPIVEQVFTPMRRIQEELREQLVPGIPPDVRGIERSGEIARMLPSEAALLVLPKLRMLWHARRAERALLTYRVEGVQTELVETEVEYLERQEERRPRPKRGPIIAVIDTSGSMSGVPETVTKAIVLQALTTAREERRRCFVFVYGGPGAVIEHELSLTEGGIGGLLQFLGHSFGGGTDIGALHRVVDKLGEPDWQKADVLLVTDGEWSPDQKLVAAITGAREAKTRFHGVQIGSTNDAPMKLICDHIYRFSEWSALLGRSLG